MEGPQFAGSSHMDGWFALSRDEAGVSVVARVYTFSCGKTGHFMSGATKQLHRLWNQVS